MVLSRSGGEGAEPLVGDAGENLRRRARRLDPPLVHEDDPVAMSRAKAISWVTTIIVMPSRQLQNDVEHLAHQLGVERRGDLVEQQDLGLHGDGPGDADPLLLAAGELGGQALELVGEPDPASQAPPPGGPPPRPAADLPSPSITFSRAVRCGNRLKRWNTMPMSARIFESSRSLRRRRRPSPRPGIRPRRRRPGSSRRRRTRAG